ncbi:MGH1-like glycoside hydrolase domain-containing protein [Flavilitoribacter nigricans]|uniref:Glucosidase n=1 Tax=Flavilitoribacter nigricans (strain ATCC 23147 / DSM 23189 / NBRC 102662 / NCIMB 1420 / SS-2) TaxID=1122177 RepID=A0A2D0N6S7_FLAN2|nr:glucosidase [Flavilitoribacter nigricans]PHN04086.1 glucosidase [Flavilitoribacter nigricans DSM 23189 = NBRC 102662]
MSSAENQRLRAHYSGEKNWLHWGPYLSERQWGTVREDYSANGDAWNYFPHDHARSRQYRWGEDGIAGISDIRCNFCFALAMWNGQDPIIKERLYGLTNAEGNHGEDVKELYYYLDNTPTHTYQKYLYKYPQGAFPYADLILTNARRSRTESEYELLDTGAFDDNRYFDVFIEYAKADAEDILIRITAHNRGPQSAPLTLLPTFWFRNWWSYGHIQEKPQISTVGQSGQHMQIRAEHERLGTYFAYLQKPEHLLFTENETNQARIFGRPNSSLFVKDAINDAVVQGRMDLLASRDYGTKCAPVYSLDIPAGESVELRLRLSRDGSLADPLGAAFPETFTTRIREADEFYEQFQPQHLPADLANIQRQALAGMLWTKQHYHYDVSIWLKGDPGLPPPPPERKHGRNAHWHTLNNQDIISMPDKWEYPWYAAWDLAFHCVPFSLLDPDFTKHQLVLFLREWYMHPSGQLPAYEWKFSDVNPPVHAWACLEVYRLDKAHTGTGDIFFLKRVFQKLIINFTWWVNRKDENNNNIFEGGFLGLDNIGVFDRSAPVPGGGILEQADGTSWMAMYCLNMLEMALEIAVHDPSFEDVATKFFEHFVYIAEALNEFSLARPQAWDEEEGFFYDVLTLPSGRHLPIKVRSLVGLSTLFASLVIKWETLEQLPDFRKRMRWFRDYRKHHKKYVVVPEQVDGQDVLLSLVPKDRLQRMLHPLLDEAEFLSPGGIRSVSKVHQDPYVLQIGNSSFHLQYEPAESSTPLYGGNSNWRGPVWIPMNYLLIRSLQTYHRYYGDQLQTDFPTGSGQSHNLQEVAKALARRLVWLFSQDENGQRPVHGAATRYQQDPHFKDLLLFYEYFNGDTGEGIGASHQTGWTGVVAYLISKL